MSRKPRK